MASVVVRGMDAAISRSLRSVAVAVGAAVAAKCRMDAEVEALKAFGTRQYGARVVQVHPKVRSIGNYDPMTESSAGCGVSGSGALAGLRRACILKKLLGVTDMAFT